MYTVNSSDMKQIEDHFFDNSSIEPLVLMEIAGIKVFNVCKKIISKHKFKKIITFCGNGNNGGDGFVVARHLFLNGYDVTVFHIGTIGTSEIYLNNLNNLNICKNIGIPIKYINDYDCDFSKNDFKDALVVDAIFGIGLNRDISGFLKKLIFSINSLSEYILSIDIPSGINSFNGEIFGISIKSNTTVTFEYIKIGMLLYPGANMCGDIIIKNISLQTNPKLIFKTKKEYLSLIDAKKILPYRNPYSNKGTFGKCFFIGGNEKMFGASILSTKAAYNVGCGLVHALVTKNASFSIISRNPEVISTILKDSDDFISSENLNIINEKIFFADSLILGPSLGISCDTLTIINNIVMNFDKNLILDADALNIISEDISILKHRNTFSKDTNIIITPHILEMSRLIKKDVKYIKENIIDVALDFAKQFNVIVVLKDSRTIIANPNGDFTINITGNNSLAKAGSGDTLSGIIGGLCASDISLYDAARLGCFIHGLSGEIASKKLTNYSVSASDISVFIPKAIKKILNS